MIFVFNDRATVLKRQAPFVRSRERSSFYNLRTWLGHQRVMQLQHSKRQDNLKYAFHDTYIAGGARWEPERNDHCRELT